MTTLREHALYDGNMGRLSAQLQHAERLNEAIDEIGFERRMQEAPLTEKEQGNVALNDRNYVHPTIADALHDLRTAPRRNHTRSRRGRCSGKNTFASSHIVRAMSGNTLMVLHATKGWKSLGPVA